MPHSSDDAPGATVARHGLDYGRPRLSLVTTKLLAQSYNDAIYMLGEASEFKDTDTGPTRCLSTYAL